MKKSGKSFMHQDKQAEGELTTCLIEKWLNTTKGHHGRLNHPKGKGKKKTINGSSPTVWASPELATVL